MFTYRREISSGRAVVVGMLVVRHGGKCTCTGREEMLSVTRGSGVRAFVVAAAAMVKINTYRREGILKLKKICIVVWMAGREVDFDTVTSIPGYPVDRVARYFAFDRDFGF